MSEAADIGTAISQAVAPAFLLTGIGGLLNVMANRLSRVIDRARLLEATSREWQTELRSAASDDLAMLARRMTAASWAIVICAMAAVLICVVVALLFVEQLWRVQMDETIAWLFISATLLLTIGLMLFVWEVQIALRDVRMRAAEIMQERP